MLAATDAIPCATFYCDGAMVKTAFLSLSTAAWFSDDAQELNKNPTQTTTTTTTKTKNKTKKPQTNPTTTKRNPQNNKKDSIVPRKLDIRVLNDTKLLWKLMASFCE